MRIVYYERYFYGENMSSLFDTRSEALMLKAVGEKSVFAVLQRDFSGT